MPVGKRLADARRAQGRQLPEIERETRIMRRMLDALEAERWDDLPAPVYVKGYIQNYATVLGLDATPLLEEYAQDIGQNSSLPQLADIPERTLVPHRLELHAIPRAVWIAVLAGVLVMVLLIWGISALFRDDELPPTPPTTTPSTSIDTSASPGVTETVEPPTTTE
jgi:cytoskeleton protein RodZ